jgi:hypothetical protein
MDSVYEDYFSYCLHIKLNVYWRGNIKEMHEQVMHMFYAQYYISASCCIEVSFVVLFSIYNATI